MRKHRVFKQERHLGDDAAQVVVAAHFKGEHVCGRVLSTMLPVELAHGGVVTQGQGQLDFARACVQKARNESGCLARYARAHGPSTSSCIHGAQCARLRGALTLQKGAATEGSQRRQCLAGVRIECAEQTLGSPAGKQTSISLAKYSATYPCPASNSHHHRQ